MLREEIKKLTWQPVGAGCEMQGASGGWACELEGGRECYGYNANELCCAMLQEVRSRDMDEWRRDHFSLGVKSAAKEKDALIEDLKRRLATGNRSDSEAVINEIKVCGISSLMRAVWQSGYGEPPMRNNWIMQYLMERHFGPKWNSDLFVAPNEPIEILPLEKSERKKFHDGSPWIDLEIIRKAAGTEDTQAIIKMLPAINPV